jgi:hypothetical protein
MKGCKQTNIGMSQQTATKLASGFVTRDVPRVGSRLLHAPLDYCACTHAVTEGTGTASFK